jgi:tetratricopeptide (TPR) repeat protein
MLLVSAALAQEASPLADAEKKMASKDYAGALAEYDKAIEKTPDDVRAHAGRAVALQALGRLDEAIAGMTKAIGISPQPDSRLYYVRAQMQTAKGDLAAAYADYSKATEIAPGEGAPYRERASIQRRQYDYEGALKDYAKAAELNPKDLTALDGLGNVKESLRDYQGAIEAYTALVYAVPQHPAPFTERGDVKLALGDDKGAIDDFDAAIYNDAKYGHAYVSRARAKRALGKVKEAEADAATAAEESPDAATFADLGRYYLDTGRAKEAAEFCAKAVGMDPEMQDYTRFFLFLARAQLGERDAAAAELKAFADGRKKKDDWYSKVAAFLTGQMNEDTFLAAAKTDNPNRTREQECEASWYAGAMRLVAGDAAGAKPLLEKCVATDVRNFMEYESAKMALAAMK